MAVRVQRKLDDCASTKSDRLDLHGLGMIQVPPRVFSLRHVTMLRLGANHLRELPHEIGQLTELKVLSLLSNQLVNLPPEIAQLRKLETLHLAQNQFTKPPWIVGSLPLLAAVTLANNPLDYAALIPEPTSRAAIQRGDTRGDWSETAKWLKQEWIVREAQLSGATSSPDGTRTLSDLVDEGAVAAVQSVTRGLIPFAHTAAVPASDAEGAGPFGRLFEVNYRNRIYQGQHVRRDLLNAGALDTLRGKAGLLASLFHRNVVQLVGYSIDHAPDVYAVTEVLAWSARALTAGASTRLTNASGARRRWCGAWHGVLVPAPQPGQPHPRAGKPRAPATAGRVGHVPANRRWHCRGPALPPHARHCPRRSHGRDGVAE